MAYLSGLISYLLDRDEEGQGLAEYALILALIAIVAIVALIFLGGQVSKILSTVGSLGLEPLVRTGRRVRPRRPVRVSGRGIVEHALILILVAIAALAFFGTAASGYQRRVHSSA